MTFWVWPRTAILNAEVEAVEERHLLIAKNLAMTLEQYHDDLVSTFAAFAPDIILDRADEAEALFKDLHFRHVCVADAETGRVVTDFITEGQPCPEQVPPARFAMFQAMAEGPRVSISGVQVPAGEAPRIYLVKRETDHLVIGAIHTTFFREVQTRINFGDRGHAVVVDAAGRVLAHPRQDWIQSARDLSGLAPVKNLTNGESGVISFESPAIKATAIAGYSAVPGAGWGVMVPQPLAELEDLAKLISLETLLILLVGMALSCALALWIAARVTNRVNHVERAAMAMASGDRTVRVEGNPDAPLEIEELRNLMQSFNRMADEIERKSAAEERLQRTQKMEALGQLTGGVAHDFNNLLQVIQGNVEILKDELGGGSHLTDPILKAAKLGGKLTQQLLAFSRMQPLQPEVVNARELTLAMSSLLTRTLGELIDIEVRTVTDLWAVEADPNQLQNALLNLALNARDAMGGRGRIVILCENRKVGPLEAEGFEEFEPGDYVVISVSDTGTGMDPSVQDRVFEPFFTTKDVGQGSGLGLAMVYGFAKQSGGHATVTSVPGEGTTVALYLRRSQVTVPVPIPFWDEDPIPQGNGEVILLVEDMAGVREVAARMLRSLGYQVIAAEDAKAASRVLATGRRVDLVLCDVVLPGGISGPEFAKAAEASPRATRVILISGHAAYMDMPEGVSLQDRDVLRKPFQKQLVARVIHDALAKAQVPSPAE